MPAASPQPTRISGSPELLTSHANSPEIADFSDRVRQAYISWGHLKEGDSFAVSYDRVKIERKDVQLGPLDPRKGLPVALDSLEFRNDGTLEQSYTFKGSKEITAGVSASVTTGFKAATTLKGGIAVKKIIEIGGEKTFEFSLSTTVSASLEVKDQKAWEWPIRVPAKSRVVATALTQLYLVQPAFTADVDIEVARHPNFDPGYHPLYVAITPRGSGETTWYRSSLEAALMPWLGGGYSRGRDHNNVRFRCAGNMSGTFGRGVLIDLKQTPLETGIVTDQTLIDLGVSDSAPAISSVAVPAADNAHAPI
jgi:hypothetical protein